MIVSSHTQARPNLSRLLCRYCISERPGFEFTSIQVNKNYQSILHCDKRNLGPSAIVGLGDYTDGKLWGQEFGAVDLSGGKWVSFDGNMPHCTLPFKGTRFTLIYFINQSYEIMQPGCLAYCRQMAGFDCWPAPGLVKRKYPPVVDRLQEGKQAYRKWLETPEGAGCSYTLPETDDEDNELEEKGVNDGKENQKSAQEEKISNKNLSASQAQPSEKKARKPEKQVIQPENEVIEMVELGEDEYAVESIIAQRVNKRRRKPEYRVRWLGYGAEDDTWEPEENFFGASKKLLAAFRKNKSS